MGLEIAKKFWEFTRGILVTKTIRGFVAEKHGGFGCERGAAGASFDS